jgi:anti-anti-sigma regulatory factor
VDEPFRSEPGPVVTRIGEALIVTLPREIDDAALLGLRAGVLDRVRRTRIRAVIFEASGLDLIDAAEFHGLAAVAGGAVWLGVRAMLVGLSAGIVAYLVDAAVDTSAFEPFGTLDDALAALGRGDRRDGAPLDAATGAPRPENESGPAELA